MTKKRLTEDGEVEYTPRSRLTESPFHSSPLSKKISSPELILLCEWCGNDCDETLSEDGVYFCSDECLEAYLSE